MPKVAIVVHTCDRYKLLFKGFEYFFEKYWDFEVHCNLYFTYEIEKPELSSFQSVPTGSGPWTTRLQKALTQIDEEYILFFQEDFWLKMPTHANFFNQLFDYVFQYKSNLIKLHNSNNYVLRNQVTSISNYPMYEIEKTNCKYLLSHQISIWKKDFLIDQLLTKETAWQNEIRGSERIRKMTTPVYCINYFQFNNLTIENHGSHYFTISKLAKLNDNIEFFLEELAENETLSAYYEKINSHYQNKWTHDKGSQPFTLSLWDRLLLKIKK